MTNPVTRRAIRVGEVPSSNLGAPIKALQMRGFCLARVLVRWALSAAFDAALVRVRHRVAWLLAEARAAGARS
jgi:hypothetical protein